MRMTAPHSHDASSREPPHSCCTCRGKRTHMTRERLRATSTTRPARDAVLFTLHTMSHTHAAPSQQSHAAAAPPHLAACAFRLTVVVREDDSTEEQRHDAAEADDLRHAVADVREKNEQHSL